MPGLGAMGLVQILDHLYIGGLTDVLIEHNLCSRNISAIVTADIKPLAFEIVKHVDYKHIPLLDVDSEDLLYFIDDTVQFIDSCRLDNKAVLVHWYAS